MNTTLSIADMRRKLLPFAVEQGKKMMVPAHGVFEYPFLDPSGPYRGTPHFAVGKTEA